MVEAHEQGKIMKYLIFYYFLCPSLLKQKVHTGKRMQEDMRQIASHINSLKDIAFYFLIWDDPLFLFFN